MCGIDHFCTTCHPTEAMEAFMRGDIHIMPTPGDNAQRCVMERRRNESFTEAVRRKDPNIDRWPEFPRLLKRLGITWCYEQKRYSTPALCLLTMANGKSVIDWIRRSERLRRRGIDPNTRPKFRQATVRLRELLEPLLESEQALALAA